MFKSLSSDTTGSRRFVSRSLKLHRGLMAQEPPDVPSFFMSGQQLANLDRIDEARQMLGKGIEQASIQNELYAAREMRQFLQSLKIAGLSESRFILKAGLSKSIVGRWAGQRD